VETALRQLGRFTEAKNEIDRSGSLLRKLAVGSRGVNLWRYNQA
jgi:hypothetical protein